MSSTASSSLLVCFPPVIDAETETLILGSFPGEKSLAASQYYAHPQNQFWRLLEAVLKEELVALPYEQRLTVLLKRHIGLWDVIAACAREGSLDSAIRQAQHNDVDALRERCPKLRRVCFNGKTSSKQAPRFAEAGFETLVLPSSSPAYAAMRFEDKLERWRAIID